MLIFFFHSLLQLGQVQPRSGSPGTDVGQTRSLCIGWSICHVMLLQNQGTSLTTLHGGSLSVTRSSSIQFHNYCNDIWHLLGITACKDASHKCKTLLHWSEIDIQEMDQRGSSILSEIVSHADNVLLVLGNQVSMFLG